MHVPTMPPEPLKGADSPLAAAPEAPRPWRSRLRLGRRALALTIILLLGAAAVVGWNVVETIRRVNAIGRLEAAGAMVTFADHAHEPLTWPERLFSYRSPFAARGLEFEGGSVTAEVLQDAAVLVRLDSITIRGARVEHGAFAPLGVLRSLKRVRLVDCQIDDPSWASLDYWLFSELSLAGSTFSADGLNNLRMIGTLELIDLSGTNLNDDQARQLGQIQNLRILNLSGTPIGNAGLRGMKRRRRLEALDLSHTQIGPGAFAGFPPSSELHTLFVRGTRLGDGEAAWIASNPNLERLDLSGTSVTAAGIERLAGLTRLTQLYLADTALGDECVPAVAGLRRLKTLALAGTSISPEALARLARELPDTTIMLDQPDRDIEEPAELGHRAGRDE